MRIIPVLDLKDGMVVGARGGARDQYRPIVTPLSASPDPVAVAEGLRGLYPFPTFYIADLDAIGGAAPNGAALGRLGEMPGPPELWVDAGIASEERVAETLAQPLLHPVLGSESQRDEMLLRRYRDHPRLVLSLDFFGDTGFRGPSGILDEPELWPASVIVMTLAKVGSGAGPDLGRLREVKKRAGDRAVFAAGGVRHETDILRLEALGMAGALVATSLHDGTITPDELVALSN